MGLKMTLTLMFFGEFVFRAQRQPKKWPCVLNLLLYAVSSVALQELVAQQAPDLGRLALAQP